VEYNTKILLLFINLFHCLYFVHQPERFTLHQDLLLSPFEIEKKCLIIDFAFVPKSLMTSAPRSTHDRRPKTYLHFKSQPARQDFSQTSSAMKLLFSAVAFVTTVFSIPDDPSLAQSYEPGQQDPQALTIFTFTKPSCKGDTIEIPDVLLGSVNPMQIRSYNLSRDLVQGYERLDFRNALSQGGPLDTSFDGNMAACATLTLTAQGKQLKEGCHTLDNPQGCLRVWIPQTAQFHN